jgi:hypothetical protein
LHQHRLCLATAETWPWLLLLRRSKSRQTTLPSAIMLTCRLASMPSLGKPAGVLD